MGKYVCKNCGSDFKQKSHYIKHLNKKKTCKTIKEKLKNIESTKEQFSELSKVLTKSLDKKIKKKNGIFFTPFNIIKQTVDSVNNYCCINDITINSVLEPSCGSCEFVKYLGSSFENKSLLYE